MWGTTRTKEGKEQSLFKVGVVSHNASFVSVLSQSEEGDGVFLQNITTCLLQYTVLHLRRHQHST
jgi:hypothetical protein